MQKCTPTEFRFHASDILKGCKTAVSYGWAKLVTAVLAWGVVRAVQSHEAGRDAGGGGGLHHILNLIPQVFVVLYQWWAGTNLSSPPKNTQILHTEETSIPLSRAYFLLLNCSAEHSMGLDALIQHHWIGLGYYFHGTHYFLSCVGFLLLWISCAIVLDLVSYLLPLTMLDIYYIIIL